MNNNYLERKMKLFGIKIFGRKFLNEKECSRSVSKRNVLWEVKSQPCPDVEAQALHFGRFWRDRQPEVAATDQQKSTKKGMICICHPQMQKRFNVLLF